MHLRIKIIVRTLEIQQSLARLYGAQRFGQWYRLGRGWDIEIDQIIVGELQPFDVHLMLTIVEVQGMHAQAALDDCRLAKFSLKVIDAEMLNRTRKSALEENPVRHFIHDLGEYTNIRKHDVGRPYRCVKDNRVNKIAESRVIMIKHAYVGINMGVVQLGIQAFEEDTLRTHHGIGRKALQIQTADVFSVQRIDLGMDGIAKQVEILCL